MIRKSFCVAATCLALSIGLSSSASAAPGVGEAVYGATVEAGETEFEARYGRLTGGTADGADGLVLEVAHGFSKNFYGAALLKLGRDPGGSRTLEGVSIEGIAPLGRIDALKLDVAFYGEYNANRGGPDEAETKLLLQHKQGGFDSRLNLVAVKPLASGAPVEFEYAASADWRLVGDIRGGFAAFGALGSTHDFLPRAEHYLGPVMKAELEHLPGKSELEIEAGYLFALSAARDETKGQIRLLLAWETHF
jgi:hypothetical protein